jgi:heme A synthase
MGGLVVLLELPVQLTTVHFMTGLFVFLLAFYMMSFDGVRESAGFSLRHFAGLFFAMGVLVFSQAALGAYVRHSQAGLACPDFPTCLGEWIPPIYNWLVLVDLSHRVVALFIVLTGAVLYAATFLEAGLAKFRDTGLMFLALCLTQFAVGALVVRSGLSFMATAIHLALALGLLSLLVHMWVRAVRDGRKSVQGME